STDQNSGNFYKPYIWSIGITRIPQGDISDSLWSIKESSFDYIDTIDFGKVYLGVKKDSLVERFIFQTAPFDLEIKSITIDSPNFTSDFSGPINLQNSLDVTFRFNPNQGGSDIGRGTIS